MSKRRSYFLWDRYSGEFVKWEDLAQNKPKWENIVKEVGSKLALNKWFLQRHVERINKYAKDPDRAAKKEMLIKKAFANNKSSDGSVLEII